MFRLFDILNVEPTYNADLVCDEQGITGAVEQFADSIKRQVFYRQSISLTPALLILYSQLYSYLTLIGYSLESIMEANYEKLCKRYPERRFTTEHSSLRLDKNPE